MENFIDSAPISWWVKALKSIKGTVYFISSFFTYNSLFSHTEHQFPLFDVIWTFLGTSCRSKWGRSSFDSISAPVAFPGHFTFVCVQTSFNTSQELLSKKVPLIIKQLRFFTEWLRSGFSLLMLWYGSSSLEFLWFPYLCSRPVSETNHFAVIVKIICHSRKNSKWKDRKSVV